jgi:hypothetical protein
VASYISVIATWVIRTGAIGVLVVAHMFRDGLQGRHALVELGIEHGIVAIFSMTTKTVVVTFTTVMPYITKGMNHVIPHAASGRFTGSPGGGGRSGGMHSPHNANPQSSGSASGGRGSPKSTPRAH